MDWLTFKWSRRALTVRDIMALLRRAAHLNRWADTMDTGATRSEQT